LGDGLVQHEQVIGNGIRAGVTPAKRRRERDSSSIGEAEHRVEPVTTLKVGVAPSWRPEWISTSDGGHGILPIGGHGKSPRVAIGIPRAWPSEFPARGR